MKRLLTLLLAAALLLSAVGCAAIFDREYYSAESYEAPSDTAETEEDTADSITNYAALRRAISRLVSEHAESAQLQFQNYDGSIRQDISTACWEVKSSTALGAFAVDYISYDLSRIVSYYQAEIYITYKRSAYQVSALELVDTMAALQNRLNEALRAGHTYLVLEMNTASVTVDTVRADLQRAYYADPLACPVLPAVEMGLYPESGVNHILEITLDYGMDSESLAQRREELGLALDVMLDAVFPPPEDTAEEEPDATPAEETEAASAEQVEALCAYLAAHCEMDESAGGTAWDALAEQAASSEGIAMALAAGCQAMGVECAVVVGRRNNEPHAWNIVTLGGASYHADASRFSETAEILLAGDDTLLADGYWWDNSEYPACPMAYGAETAEEASSAEPSETASGELFGF